MGGDRFAGRAAFFDDHYRSSTRGRVRLRLVMDRLSAALPPPPARILDAGGGTGAFAIPLARGGHPVTILDPSAEWLAMAGQRAAEAGVQLTLVQGRAEEADRLAPGPFDVVLCHTVLIYASDPGLVLRTLRAVAASGAVLSSLEKNRDALAVRPSHEGDWAEAMRVLDDPVASGRLGVTNRALTGGELRSLLVTSGWLPERWGGIRVFSDGAPNEVDPDALEAIIRLEAASSTREPHRRFGRLLHILARAAPDPAPSLSEVQTTSFARAGSGIRESWPEEMALTEAELSAFLGRTRYGVLSTGRADGRPHATMVAFVVRDDRVWLPAVGPAVRIRNVRREPWASLIVATEAGERHVAVLIEGHAVVREDVDDLLAVFLRNAWRRRHGTELDWAGAVIELIPARILSHGHGRVR